MITLLIYLFIWGFTLLSTLYRSYHDRQCYVQRKPVHSVGQGSVLYTADQRQVTTIFLTVGRARNQSPASEVGGESVTTLPLWPQLLC